MTAEPDPTEGWALWRESWSFHRQFFERCGRPAEHREYFEIIVQIRRRKAEPVCKHRWRVKLRDERVMTVIGGPTILHGVLPGDWQPPVEAPPPVVAMPAPEPVAAAPPLPPSRPVRATTLTLGAKGDKAAAEKALAAHLQRIGFASPSRTQAA